MMVQLMFFFFSSRRRHTRYWRDWSSDVCSSDLAGRRDDVYWAGRITLVSRPEEIETYDRAFELFWEKGASAKARRRPKVRSEERRVGKECRSRWSPYH